MFFALWVKDILLFIRTVLLGYSKLCSFNSFIYCLFQSQLFGSRGACSIWAQHVWLPLRFPILFSFFPLPLFSWYSFIFCHFLLFCIFSLPFSFNVFSWLPFFLLSFQSLLLCPSPLFLFCLPFPFFFFFLYFLFFIFLYFLLFYFFQFSSSHCFLYIHFSFLFPVSLVLFFLSLFFFRHSLFTLFEHFFPSLSFFFYLFFMFTFNKTRHLGVNIFFIVCIPKKNK